MPLYPAIPRYTGAASDLAFVAKVAGETYDSIQVAADGTIKLGDGTAAPVASFDEFSTDRITNAIEPLPRKLIVSNGVAAVSGRQFFNYFTPQITLSVDRVKCGIGGTLGVSLTLVKWGVWEVDGSGNLTQVLVTADVDTSFMSPATTFSLVTTSFTGTATLNRGTRYCHGPLVVGTTPPSFYGNSLIPTFFSTLAPNTSKATDGNADSPASVAVGSLGNSGFLFYAVLDHS